MIGDPTASVYWRGVVIRGTDQVVCGDTEAEPFVLKPVDERRWRGTKYNIMSLFVVDKETSDEFLNRFYKFKKSFTFDLDCTTTADVRIAIGKLVANILTSSSPVITVRPRPLVLTERQWLRAMRIIRDSWVEKAPPFLCNVAFIGREVYDAVNIQPSIKHWEHVCQVMADCLDACPDHDFQIKINRHDMRDPWAGGTLLYYPGVQDAFSGFMFDKRPGKAGILRKQNFMEPLVGV